jgi:hypothetical protein
MGKIPIGCDWLDVCPVELDLKVGLYSIHSYFPFLGIFLPVSSCEHFLRAFGWLPAPLVSYTRFHSCFFLVYVSKRSNSSSSMGCSDSSRCTTTCWMSSSIIQKGRISIGICDLQVGWWKLHGNHIQIEDSPHTSQQGCMVCERLAQSLNHFSVP